MKPRISLRHGIWRCRTVFVLHFGMTLIDGYGYTPSLAYQDWDRERKAGHV